jgi:hypothetical protein
MKTSNSKKKLLSTYLTTRYGKVFEKFHGVIHKLGFRILNVSARSSKRLHSGSKYAQSVFLISISKKHLVIQTHSHSIGKKKCITQKE